MKDAPSLDDLRLFLAVADAGSLGAAAKTTGVSAPTLSRRMSALERALSARLFERGPQGYRLTLRGRALLEETADLRRVTAGLEAFASAAPIPRVRITAGLWTARHIARHADALTGAGRDWWPELLASNATVDIARREADIGLRNLDVVMGLENRIVYDLVNVIEGVCKVNQAMIHDKSGYELYLIPAAQTRDKNSIDPEQLRELCAKLEEDYDYVLMDCPAGIEQGFKNAVSAAQEAIIVTTPEVSAIRDADRVIGLLEAAEMQRPKLIINRILP